MKDEIKEILDNTLEYLEGNDETRNTKILTTNETNILLDYIINLEKVADERMSTILDIEKYCIDEKEDLTSGGEVCEDVLKIIDELKGK